MTEYEDMMTRQIRAMRAISEDQLANEIRRVDGAHSLGAGALAEALLPFLAEHDRQVAERAWDEAIQHQWAHRPIGNRSPHNPHRKGAS